LDQNEITSPISDFAKPESVEISDHTLIRNFKAGDEKAFDQLVLRHQARVFNFVYQCLHNAHDAQDVAQDVFVKVYFALNRFREEAQFSTWVYQITRNAMLNHIRKHSKYKNVSLEQTEETTGKVLEDSSASAQSPDASAVAAEREEELGRAIAQLSPKLREVLVMREIDDLSYDDLSQVLKCSIGTIKSRLARARDSLRELLGDGWFVQ